MINKLSKLESIAKLNPIITILLALLGYATGLFQYIHECILESTITLYGAILIQSGPWALLILTALVISYKRKCNRLSKIDLNDYEYISTSGLYKQKLTGRYCCPNCLDNANKVSILSEGSDVCECECGRAYANPNYDSPGIAISRG